jgi:flagellar hook-length control protein FliK
MSHNCRNRRRPAAQFATQPKPLDPELLKEVVGRQANVGKQSEASKKAAGTEQIETDQVSDEPVDAPDLALESSAPAHVSGKPQPSTGDSDAQRIVQARGELPVSDHSHNDVPSTPTDNLVSQKGSVIGSTQAHAASSAARSAALVAQPDPQPTAVGGLAIEIAGKALAGKNRFEIRLDPPELGRIEVRLDVDRDGNVTSRLTVERADTLDLLRRDAAGLERALQDAGLKTANNGLQFSLRDQSLNQQPGSGSSDAAQLVVQDETQPLIDLIPQNYGRLAGSGGGLDILV